MGVQDYEIHGCVGKGTFGDVYKANSIKDNSIVAIKVIHLDDTTEDINVLIQEIQFLSGLRSSYITKYLETFINGMSMWIVMEYCGGGSCGDLLKCHKKLNEEVTAYIIRDVLRGLVYLHGQKKVHRDIKSANILLTIDGKIKLADFGVSGEITMTQLKRNTFVGTPFWMAPEVITRQKSGYNEKADIWSTGITTIELVTGSPPLSEHNPLKILFEIPKKKPPVLTGIQFSENIKDFVKYCLIKDPTKRPSSSSLLHHKYVTNIKRHVNLIQLIEQKDKWYKKYHITKKPKHELNFEESTSEKVHWNFDSTRKLSPMQQTLIEDLNNLHRPYQSHKVDEEMDADSNSSSSNSINNSAVTPTSKTPISSPLPNNVNYNEVFKYCLERVKLRAKSVETRITVNNLMNNIHQYELDQPGLSEAIIEEILKLDHLLQR
ncbi:sporulation-specific protein 1 [[Candida] jaroonii]|uniref:Sporulation-specific protein 1 n=1 Tax=[Candida] jaroonii TaxID=467808 RepID=A0ACA9YCP1_9ASCO|nr:sporulation-specific protein 1 [[Candida] jaroonii]